MYWPLWLLARYPELSWQKQPSATAATAPSGFMNEEPFPLMEGGFYLSKWTWQKTIRTRKKTWIDCFIFKIPTFKQSGGELGLFCVYSDFVTQQLLKHGFSMNSAVDICFYFLFWLFHFDSVQSSDKGNIIMCPGRSVCGKTEECGWPVLWVDVHAVHCKQP